jgi:hypothetical protein
MYNINTKKIVIKGNKFYIEDDQLIINLNN